MTATAPYPTQLLLEGQSAAPEGPVDLAGMYLMHRAFRRDLNRFADAAAVLPASDRKRWTGISRRFTLFATVLHKHHHGEDVGLWPLLAERGADRGVLDALEAEHAVIDPLLSSVTDDLRALADGGGDETTRARLARTTAELRDALRTHLAHEESDGMTLVQQHLTAEDWDRLDREVFAKDYSAREVPAVIGWIASGCPNEALGRMPGANRALVRLARLLARRFDRRDTALFGGSVVTTRSDRLRTVISRHAGRVHTRVLRRTGWRVGTRWMGGDVLLLTHRGRRSGHSYTTPVLHVRDGADFVVAASNGGIDHEPQWWLNLQADPRGTVEVAGRRTEVLAGEVAEADRGRLWDALMAKCGNYDKYQASVSRRISLVRLSPVPSASA
jgi:deazaflavin-dependent oxidoreductase (nitroreductase family)